MTPSLPSEAQAPRRARLVAIAFLVLVICATPVACSTDTPRLGVATREITESEMMLHGIESADAIVLATVLSAQEELVPRSETETPGDYAMLAYCTVLISDVLLGTHPRLLRGASPPIVISSGKLEWFRAEQRRGEPVLLFLRQFPHDKFATTARHGSLVFSFGNPWIADVPGEGALAAGRTKIWDLKHKVNEAIELSKPCNMVKLADLVIRGHHEGRPAICEGNTRHQICANIVIDEVLYGDAPRGAVAVFTAVPGYVRTEECIYFLKRTPEGSFEVVGLSGGIRGVKGRIVGRRKDTLDSVRRQMALAEAARRNVLRATPGANSDSNEGAK